MMTRQKADYTGRQRAANAPIGTIKTNYLLRATSVCYNDQVVSTPVAEGAVVQGLRK